MGDDFSDFLEETTGYKPSSLESVLFFFLEKGVTIREFEELPIPYILSMLKVGNYYKEKELKAIKKARRK